MTFRAESTLKLYSYLLSRKHHLILLSLLPFPTTTTIVKSPLHWEQWPRVRAVMIQIQKQNRSSLGDVRDSIYFLYFLYRN